MPIIYDKNDPRARRLIPRNAFREPMNVADLATTAIQLAAVIGGIVLCFTGQPVVGAGLVAAGLAGGSRGDLVRDVISNLKEKKQ